MMSMMGGSWLKDAASLGMEMTTTDCYRLIADADGGRLVADADGGRCEVIAKKLYMCRWDKS